ncbi:MAG TPA: hypothetical protein PLY05_10640, partial [Agitococcus sp.]|nr:hypothetical protein [Agitococcus sp.]
AFKDGSYSYEVIFNNNALYEINLSLTSFLGQFTPTATTQPTTETCASKNLAVATLSSIADYNGDYKEAGTVVFNLNTATAKASVKGTEANITEVCGPTVITSGTNHVLITDKGNVTLFKTTAGVQSAEGYEFVNKNNTFYGEKAGAALTNLAASGTATGTISNVQYNKDGTTTGGTGQVRSKVYTFSGDLNGTYTIKIKDTAQNLRYDVNGTNGKPSSVNLYSAESSASPLFVYTCDDSSCLSKVSLTQSSTGTTVKFTDMKMRGVYQAQYDAIINGQSLLTANTLCESTGHDTKLGFKNAPSDFCSFSYTYGTSTAISSPDIYTFKDSTDPMANAKVTVLNGSVQTFQLENSKYAYACGVGNMPACVGITIQSNTNSNIEFKFANVQVANVDSTKQGMIIDSGLLMHKKATQTTTPVNLAACLTQKTSVSAINCSAQVIPDFTLNMRSSVTLINNSCTVSKVGQILTATSGAISISAKLNEETIDLARVDSTYSLVNATDVVNNLSNTVQITYSSAGAITNVIAQGNGGGQGFFCGPNQ